MKVKDSEEITERIGFLTNKFQLITLALLTCKGEVTENQENRLIEQLDTLMTQTDRVIKNLIILEDKQQ